MQYCFDSAESLIYFENDILLSSEIKIYNCIALLKSLTYFNRSP